MLVTKFSPDKGIIEVDYEEWLTKVPYTTIVDQSYKAKIIMKNQEAIKIVEKEILKRKLEKL